MSSVIANVVEFEAVQPHPNADRLFLARIKGWWTGYVGGRAGVVLQRRSDELIDDWEEIVECGDGRQG